MPRADIGEVQGQIDSARNRAGGGTLSELRPAGTVPGELQGRQTGSAGMAEPGRPASLWAADLYL